MLKTAPLQPGASPSQAAGPVADTTAPTEDIVPSLDKGACKTLHFKSLPGGAGNAQLQKRPGKPAAAASRVPLLQVHGNVLYELSYRSFIDTPYTDHDVAQHLVQAYLDITYKDNYPFRVYLTNRWSNSPLLRNYADLGLQYNRNDFAGRVRRLALQALARRFNTDSLQRLWAELESKQKQYDQLRRSIDSGSAVTRLVGAREDKWLAEQYPGARPSPGLLPSLSDKTGLYRLNRASAAADSSALLSSYKNIRQRYDTLQQRLDTLQAQAARLYRRYQQFKSLQEARYALAQRQVNNCRDGKTLADSLHRWGVSDSSLPKGYQALLAVRSLGFGRTILDYSELSAKNVSINGFQAEYNPGSYWAVALGSVDYRFRDYVVTPPARGQYIGVVRFGKGRPDGNHIIGTWYSGRRQLYNAYTNPQTGAIPNYSLMGFTLETRYQLSRTSYLSAEIAKSSLPYYSLDSSHAHRMLGSVFSASDRSNEAWSVSLNSFFPSTQTQVSAAYQRYGANFQSFSLFTNGVVHNSWKLMADQPFFKKQLLVRAGVRTNDFSNPLLGAGYQSSAVFGTLQATLRMKKWPILQLGYFPSSQLLKTSDGRYEENLFFTLSASATHTYRLAHVQMMSLLLYTRFYNQQRDSALVYYNTRNIQASQSVFLGRLTCQLQASAALAATYNLYMMEGRLDLRCSRWLSLGGGVKYSDQTVYDSRQWGYSGTMTLKLSRLGEIQALADKGFIPGSNRQLVPSNIGRLSYFKTF